MPIGDCGFDLTCRRFADAQAHAHHADNEVAWPGEVQKFENICAEAKKFGAAAITWSSQRISDVPVDSARTLSHDHDSITPPPPAHTETQTDRPRTRSQRVADPRNL